MNSLASYPIPCRRQAVRRWVRIEAEIVRAHDFVKVGGCIVDLSEDGLRARGECDALVVGDELIVAFRAPATGDWIERTGWVAHLEPASAEEGASFGVVFEPGDEDDRAALSDLLARLPPVIPRRDSGTYLRMVD
jgi:PilZ domain